MTDKDTGYSRDEVTDMFPEGVIEELDYSEDAKED